MRHFLSPDNLSFGWDQFPADYSYYLKTLNSDPVKVQIYTENSTRVMLTLKGEPSSCLQNNFPLLRQRSQLIASLSYSGEGVILPWLSLDSPLDSGWVFSVYIVNHEKSIPRPEGEGVLVGGKQSSHAGLGRGQRSSKITLGAVHNNQHFLLFIWTKQSLWQFSSLGKTLIIMDDTLQTQSKSPRLFYSLPKCNCHSCSFQIFESVLSLVLYNVWTSPSSELC